MESGSAIRRRSNAPRAHPLAVFATRMAVEIHRDIGLAIGGTSRARRAGPHARSPGCAGCEPVVVRR